MGSHCCTAQICQAEELKCLQDTTIHKNINGSSHSHHLLLNQFDLDQSSTQNQQKKIQQLYDQKQEPQHNEEQKNANQIDYQDSSNDKQQKDNQQQYQQEQSPKPVAVDRKQKQSSTIVMKAHGTHIIQASFTEIKRKNEHRSTNVQNITMRLGADIFIHLKQGCIHNQYDTGQLIGQGGYGKVWKVTHKATGLIRAMKQLKKSALIKEEQQRLFSEMTILKNLDHPHIVKLFELYQDNLNYYLITEYLSGGELFERIRQLSYYSEKKASELMGQILSAIVYCHDRKIVHRDLKPENIIFVSQDTASLKIIDFGTSRKFNSKKKMTKKLGTPYYIAPEVIKQEYNEKCDVWSCGVILYVLLCGYPPFRGRNEKEVMAKVEQGDYTFDPEEWGSISQEAKLFIGKMLQLDPKVRISARNAMKDPWMQKHAPNQPINPKALKNLQRFHAKSLFQQAILSYIASQMTSQEETAELQKTFKGLDRNNDGMLSKEELISGYSKLLDDKKKAEEEVDKILKLIDLNQSGKVDFTEFLMAAMNQTKLLSSEKVKAAFQIFDSNGDGMISRQELEEVMGALDEEVNPIHSYSKLWNQILIDCGNSIEGFITEKEFIKLLLQKV